MKLDLSAAWDGAIKLIAANREVLLVLVGAFIFVPNLAVALFIPELDPFGSNAGETDPEAMIAAVQAAYAEYWWVVLIVSLIQFVGVIAILSVLGDSSRPTVGSAIQSALGLVLTFLIANILIGIIIGLILSVVVAIGALAGTAIGILLGLLFVPVALYLLVKFSLSSPVIAVEKEKNPVAALRRSWRLTKGNSLRLFFFYFLLMVAFVVLSMVLSLVFGLVFALLGESGALIGTAVFSGLLNALFALAAYAVLVSVHGQLTQGSAAVSVPSTHNGAE